MPNPIALGIKFLNLFYFDSLHCGLNETNLILFKEERRAILKVLTKGIKVHQDVNFSLVAEKTVGWSGARLKGLVTSARFLAQFPASENGASIMDFVKIDLFWPDVIYHSTVWRVRYLRHKNNLDHSCLRFN